MHAARNVYLLIGFMALLPWVGLSLKKIIPIWKRSRKTPTLRLILMVVGTVLISMAVFWHYQLTIHYQAPLVAERVGHLLNERLQGGMEHFDYENALARQRLIGGDYQGLSDKELMEAGFVSGRYALAVSQRSFPQAPNVTMLYLRHTVEGQEYYTSVLMQLTGRRWQVLEQQTLNREALNAVENNMRFTPVNR